MNPRNLLVASLASLIISSTATFAQVRYSIIDLTERAHHLGVVQAERTAINHNGQIVVVGRRFAELGHAFLLTPLAACDPCDMNCDGNGNALDIEPFLKCLFG
ncbi:MAG: hypothetical protein IID33_11560 [Planctomycetes bacterium]|nr:hypothetical protein [Planctomycetota bacterium]